MRDQPLLRQGATDANEETLPPAAETDRAQTRPRWQTGAEVALLGVGVACLAWPRTTPLLAGRLDPDWEFALQYFAARRASGYVFTYGPLGFLAQDRVFTSAASLALLVKAAVWFSVAWLALRSIPHRLGDARRLALAALLFLAFAPAFVASWITVAGPAAVWWAFLYIDGRIARRCSPVSLGSAMGALGGLVLLTKTSSGAIVVAASILALAGRAFVEGAVSGRQVKVATSWIAGLGAALVIGPLMVGWGPGDVRDWARGSFELMTNYAAAMGDTEPIRLEGWVVLGLLVASIGVAAGCARCRREALAIAAVASFAGWLTVRADYVRWRPPVATYALIIGLSVAAPIGRFSRDRLGRHLARVALAAAAAIGLLLAATSSYGYPITGSAAHVAAAAQDVRLAALPSEREQFIETQRARFRETLALSPEIVRALHDCTAHAVPVDVGLFYAYPEVKWQPPPVFQDYVAYSSWLDEENASFYRSDRAPGCIVRRASVALDGRAARFEPPESQIVLTCRYEVVDFDGTFELLLRTQNRCGSVQPIKPTTARFGELDDVPTQPDSLTVVRILLSPTPAAEQVVALLWRPGPMYVGNGEAWYRFLPGHARAWHLLRAPDCPDTLLPTSANPPFHQFSLATAPAANRSEKSYQIQYGFVPYRCPTP